MGTTIVKMHYDVFKRQHAYNSENDLRYTQIKHIKKDVVDHNIYDVSSSPCDHLRPYYALKVKMLLSIIPK